MKLLELRVKPMWGGQGLMSKHRYGKHTTLHDCLARPLWLGMSDLVAGLAIYTTLTCGACSSKALIRGPSISVTNERDTRLLQLCT